MTEVVQRKSAVKTHCDFMEEGNANPVMENSGGACFDSQWNEDGSGAVRLERDVLVSG